MADTYDEQIEAILAGDVERFIEAAQVERFKAEAIRSDVADRMSLFFSAWNRWNDGSLFANLPGCGYCASQIHTPGYRQSGSKEAEFYQLIRSTGNRVLRNPGRSSKPTREILNEFARRQRLCRAAT